MIGPGGCACLGQAFHRPDLRPRPEKLRALRTALEQVLDEEAAKSEQFKRVLESWRPFLRAAPLVLDRGCAYRNVGLRADRDDAVNVPSLSCLRGTCTRGRSSRDSLSSYGKSLCLMVISLGFAGVCGRVRAWFMAALAPDRVRESCCSTLSRFSCWPGGRGTFG